MKCLNYLFGKYEKLLKSIKTGTPSALLVSLAWRSLKGFQFGQTIPNRLILNNITPPFQFLPINQLDRQFGKYRHKKALNVIPFSVRFYCGASFGISRARACFVGLFYGTKYFSPKGYRSVFTAIHHPLPPN